MSELLKVTNLSVHFPVRTRGVWRKTVGRIVAVDNVSFSIARGETLGLVGESGSGKTTLGLAILRGTQPTSGQVELTAAGGTIDVTRLDKQALRDARQHFQMIFQDPYSSLNARMTVRDIIAEPLIARRHQKLDRKAIDQRVIEIAEKCGLNREQLRRYPHAFSGGQRQRIAIARALVLHPDLVVCDEPTSSLDVSIQAQILNLLAELQESLGLTYLFIAHDLAAVAYVCDRVAVMYLGQIVEIGATRDVYFTPRHPYTEALMSSVPEPDPAAPLQPMLLQGERPDPANPPSGCRFRTRCRYATELCAATAPAPVEIAPNHFAACHYAKELSLKGALALRNASQEKVVAE
jgi:peptide/nickel transport system ATP-binding protein